MKEEPIEKAGKKKKSWYYIITQSIPWMFLSQVDVGTLLGKQINVEE